MIDTRNYEVNFVFDKFSMQPDVDTIDRKAVNNVFLRRKTFNKYITENSDG